MRGSPRDGGRGARMVGMSSPEPEEFSAEAPTILRAMGRAFSRHCPRCGTGDILESRFRLLQSCSDCGLCYRKESGAMTGQMYLTAIITEIFTAVLVLVVFFLTDLDTLSSIALGLPLVVLFSYLVLPISMRIWVAVEYVTDRVGEAADHSL